MFENLKKHNFKFNHSLGQNFITDKNLLYAIAKDAGITSKCTVLEIGAGAGTLTQILCELARQVVSVEIDKSLKPILNENLKNFNNVELIFDDFLKIDYTTLEQKLLPTYKVVANLPYYITTPIIFRLLENSKGLNSLTLMVQKEVALRAVAKAGTKDYGLLSVSLNAIADVEITRTVNRTMFTPPPNVDSAILNITINKNKYKFFDYEHFKKLTKSAFAMRRKTLCNNLKSTFGYSNEVIHSALSHLNLSINIRGEALTVNEFVALSNLLYKM